MHFKQLLSLLFALTATLVNSYAAPPPNILFILADDGGSHDFGFQDNPALEVLTPHLDRLAEDSARFTNAHTNGSMCAPSRAGLVTGRYPHRFGFQQNYPESNSIHFKSTWNSDRWLSMGIDPTEKTFGDHLQANGYKTALIGKSHFGYADAFHPTIRGFDTFWGIRGGSRPYFPSPELESAPPPKKFDRIESGHQFIPESEITYVTDDLTDAAERFIREHRDGPFFVFLSYTAPHTPLQGHPDDVQWIQENLPDLAPKRVQNLAMIRGLDRNFGKLRASLQAQGLADNTIIVFAVDNGGSIRGLADNSPHRGYKYSPYEGGLRVPLLINWPGVTHPGSLIHDPVMLFDLPPTFVEAAGGNLAAQSLPFDGQDLRPLLRDGSHPKFSERVLHWREINSAGATRISRAGDYKLILYGSRPPELYNLTTDPSESTNLASKQPKIVRQLSNSFFDWESEMPAPRWFQH